MKWKLKLNLLAFALAVLTFGLPDSPGADVVPTVGGDVLAQPLVTAYWGPGNDWMCNRSGWVDVGLIIFSVVTVKAEQKLAYKLGKLDMVTSEEAVRRLGQGVTIYKTARVFSVVGWIALGAEIALQLGDMYYCAPTGPDPSEIPPAPGRAPDPSEGPPDEFR